MFQRTHVMALADSTRHSGCVSARGDARCEVMNDTGKVLKIILTNVPLIPEYPQDISSVEAAVLKGMKFKWKSEENVTKITNVKLV